MKAVFLRFTDADGKTTQTFTATSLKTGAMDNIFDIAERAEGLQKGGAGTPEVRSFYADLKALIVSIFGNKFSYDELNANVEVDELMKVFNDICRNVTGEMQKN